MRDSNFKYSFIIIIITLLSSSSLYCIEILFLYHIGPIRAAAFYGAAAARRHPRVWPG